MIAKVAILLFASCAVALARPQNVPGLNGLEQNQINPQQQLNNGLNELQQYQQQYLQNLNRLQGLNPNQLQNLPSGYLNGYGNGYNGNYNGNTRYQTPLLDLPNHAIDWSQNVIDSSVSRVGSALGQTYDNTQRVANNVVDTVSQVGSRGLQDGSSIVKSGINLFSEFPRIGLDLLSRNNRNNYNNGYGY